MLRLIVFGRDVRRTLLRVAGLSVAATAVFGFVLLPVRAEGISMLPTYSPGSLKLVNVLAYRLHEPERGDVVAIRLAGAGAFYITRIVALPGERLRIEDGTVFVDGRPLHEPYVRRRATWHLDEIVLDEGEYFVAGDNRGMSINDHTLGKAKRARIAGKVVF
jgi:signal peptidase I